MKVPTRQLKTQIKVALRGFSEELSFKFEFILSFFIIIIQSVIYVVVFSSLFRSSQLVNTKEIIGYYIVVNIIGLSMIPAQFVAWQHQEDINSGQMILYLIRPNGFLLFNYLKFFIPFLARFLVNFIFIVLAGLVFELNIFYLDYAFGFISALGGFTIFYLLQAIVGSQAVWLHDATRLRDVLFTSLLILGGRLIPSRYLFSWLKDIIYFTPLPYVYDVPTAIFTGGSVFSIAEALLRQLFWIILLGTLYIRYFNERVKHNLEYGT